MADIILPSASSLERDTARRLDGPIHAERHIRVVCVGAGASGLLFAYKLQKHFKNFSLTIYEKNEEVAGTWFENRYPGCACDVPSHNYTYSFEPKLDWSSVYPPAREILQYFKDFASKYNLYQYIRTRHQVVGAYWKDDIGGYALKIKDLHNNIVVDDTCNILINASGILNDWQWPAIPGLDSYQGKLLHTANWDDSVSLEGKHVGLIGNGSSGIQVLPAIRDTCSKVTTFIREPTWVSPVQGLDQHIYSAEERNEFVNTPGALLNYRKDNENGINAQFGIFLKDNPINLETHQYMSAQMKQKLSNRALEEKLIPTWSVGCRRLTPGVGYLESLTKPGVQVVYGEISEVTTRGCVCDGQEYPVDILICATGFNTSFRPRFPIVNHKGQNLQDLWEVDPVGYLGVGAADFPNFCIFLGPNCPIGNGPLLVSIEAQADWMCMLIDRLQTRNIASLAPRAEAVRDFVAHKDRFMSRTVWSDPCRSWYKQRPDGPITALWPGSSLHYIEAIKTLDLEDFNVNYIGDNRFAWLGNGYSQTELDDTADWAYYIREADDDAPLSTGGKRRALTKSGTIKERRIVAMNPTDGPSPSTGLGTEQPQAKL